MSLAFNKDKINDVHLSWPLAIQLDSKDMGIGLNHAMNKEGKGV